MNYKTVEQKVINFIKSQKLIEPQDNILIALSGGADSVFLLTFLSKFKNLFKISVSAAHINHSLRGHEANLDQEFSRNICKKMGIPFFTRRVYVKSFAKKNGLSIEEAARNLRYASLKKIAKKNDINKIATAHNIDDNAETVLFNLARGSGISGMAGIPYKRENIIRPVLILSKSEITEYLQNRKIPFSVDSTNFDDSFSRNFIRNQIIPSLRENINSSFSESVFKFSDIFKNYSRMISSLLQNAEKEFTRFENDTLTIDLTITEHYTDVLISEILKNLLQKYFSVEFNFKDSLKLNALLANQTGKRILFKNNLTAVRERNSIVLFVKKTNSGTIEHQFSLNESVETKIGVLRITKLRNKNNNYTFNQFSEIISADNLEDIFILRSWKNGDKFIPLGMKNFKKVSDFLTEQKVPSNKKKEQLVLINGNKIIWVVGHRIDNRFRILKNSKKIFRLWIK